MDKRNRLGKMNLDAPESEDAGRSDAEAEMTGEDPWLGESRDARVSMRVEPSIKEIYKETLPHYVNLSNAIRRHMIEEIQKARRE